MQHRMKIGNYIPLEIRKRQEIEDLANSMLETFATEYRTAYGCEVIASSEDCDEDTFSFSLKYCPWERLDYPIKKGYLTKQGGMRKTWRRRFFVVQPNYLVDYYENEEAYEKGLKPRGTINPCGYIAVSNLENELAKRRMKLATMLGISQPDSPEKFPNHVFGVIHDKLRSYFIHGDSEEEKLEWVEMFQLCCSCVRGFNISDTVGQSTFNKALSRTLASYGHTTHHNYRGPEDKVICDVITAEIDGRFMAEICRNVKGNFAAKSKIRDQVLKDLNASVMSLVTPLWKNLMGDKDRIQLQVEALICEKEREIAAVRRKVEWEMNGKTEAFLNDALIEVRKYSQKILPTLEKSMFDALCEVRNVYQKNVVEIGIDVEQREEVEIPVQMYIDSLDMLARTPSEVKTAYQYLDIMEKELKLVQLDLNTFDVAGIMDQAQERIRYVMDGLVNTFQQRFLEVFRGIEGKQKHKKLRELIEDVDDEVANRFENDVKEIISCFNMKTLKTVFLPCIHNNIDRNCSKLIESADRVIPEYLKGVVNRNNEYRRLVERSLEELLKQVMDTKDEMKQRSFRASLRSSRRKTFPKFSSRPTKFQDANKKLVRRTSLPVSKTGDVLCKGSKASLTSLFACLPIQTELRDSCVYDVPEGSNEDDMQEINLTLKRGSASRFGTKT